MEFLTLSAFTVIVFWFLISNVNKNDSQIYQKKKLKEKALQARYEWWNGPWSQRDIEFAKRNKPDYWK